VKRERRGPSPSAAYQLTHADAGPGFWFVSCRVRAGSLRIARPDCPDPGRKDPTLGTGPWDAAQPLARKQL